MDLKTFLENNENRSRIKKLMEDQVMTIFLQLVQDQLRPYAATMPGVSTDYLYGYAVGSMSVIPAIKALIEPAIINETQHPDYGMDKILEQDYDKESIIRMKKEYYGTK